MTFTTATKAHPYKNNTTSYQSTSIDAKDAKKEKDMYALNVKILSKYLHSNSNKLMDVPTVGKCIIGNVWLGGSVIVRRKSDLIYRFK